MLRQFLNDCRRDENIKGSPGPPRRLTTVDTCIANETGTADSEVDTETVFDNREGEVGSMYINVLELVSTGKRW
jgi:hypothetical protein